MEKYDIIIEKAKQQLRKRGWEKDRICNAFGKSNNEIIKKVLVDLYETYSYFSIIYYEEDRELLELKNYKIPERVIEFYINFEPKELDYLADGVSLYSLEEIKESNSKDPLGASLIKYGLFTFAGTIGGNLICMDLNRINNEEPRVVYVDHTWFCFNYEARKIERSRFSFKHKNLSSDEKWLTLDIIEKYLPEVSDTFSNFISKLASYENWDLEQYYHRIGNVLNED